MYGIPLYGVIWNMAEFSYTGFIEGSLLTYLKGCHLLLIEESVGGMLVLSWCKGWSSVLYVISDY